MKRTIIVTLMLAMMMALIPTGVFAASKTVKSKMYEIYKSKNAVYVACNNRLFKVKLKNGKPVSKKVLVKCKKSHAIDHLIVKGKYVYYTQGKGTATSKIYIYRVKKSGGKAKKLAAMNSFGQMALRKNKIYYSYDSDETDENGMILKTYKKVMNLNGKSKKDTDIEAMTNFKYYNKKGYKFSHKIKGSTIKAYLKTPKGKIFLAEI